MTELLFLAESDPEFAGAIVALIGFLAVCGFLKAIWSAIRNAFRPKRYRVRGDITEV